MGHVFPLLLKKHPMLEYHILGDGPERKKIQTLITEKKLEKNVHLLGELDDAARETELQQADLLIVPNMKVANDMEGFGIVCIEASARGIPVVAGRLEGLQDAVIDGKTGAFFAQGDAIHAVSVIEALLVSPLDRVTVRQETATRYDWSHLISRYCNEVFR